MEFLEFPMRIRFHDVIESFYIETLEGFFFAVKGLEHPPERFIAVLRYVPDEEKGDRRKGKVRYRRLYKFREQESFIKATCPQYLAYDPVFRTNLQSVPRSSVRRIYDPRIGLQKLLRAPAKTDIEEDAAAFALLLRKKSKAAHSSLGITGSLLIGLHKESSDLDIAVFGKRDCLKVFQALRELLDARSCPGLCRLDAEGMEELYEQRLADTHMDLEDFARLESRKVNQGKFRNRTYFIRFVKEKSEPENSYGCLHYTPVGRANISASVSDDEDSIFTPCKYGASGAYTPDGNPLPDLKEIVSFRGRFCEQARVGESIVAAGMLERVRNGQGDIWWRLLLGNFPEDTMIVQKGRWG
jgi:predicted nucleotidyltransferase